MSIFIKLGAVGDVSKDILKAFEFLDNYYKDVLNEDVMITSIRDGYHSNARSLHHNGNAIDFRSGGANIAHLKRRIKETLGDDYDFVESNHGALHLEYDPK